MSFVPNFPPSVLRKFGDQESEDGKKKTKEDFKKMKEIEEARKLAVMPAMKDEEGRDINPHIPQYIMQAPWYYGSLKPTLKHQRMQDEEKREALSGTDKGSAALNKWYKRGVPLGAPRAKGFRDGACENCGAITHDRKNCLERPRKVGAKYTGLDIAPDDIEQDDIKLGYDAKRDRWNGYDPREHQRFIAEFQRFEEARKIVKAKKIEEKLAAAASKSEGQEMGSPSGPNLDDEEGDDDRYGEELDMPGQKFDSKQRQSIRNLRIREDTAKYLYNLDPNSAYYDPKTRSMRENPFENSGKSESEVPFAGDNYIRNDGDAPAMLQRQVFVWEMQNKLGLDLHLQADPTRLELLAKKVSMAKEQAHSAVREEILERYGGREHLEAPPRDLLLGQWESYAEYTPTGRVLKGSEKVTVKSRYEEDVFLKNHKSVWGSYWYAGQWGYRCCHSLIKESYCTGDKGKAGTGLANPGNSNTSTTDLPEVPAEAQTGSSVLAPLLPLSNTVEGDETSKSSDREDEEELAEQARQREMDFARSKERRERRAKKRKNKKKNKSKRGKKRGKRSSSVSRSSSSASSCSSESEDEEVAREKRIQAEMEKEKKRLREVDELLALDERKRPYHSLSANDAHIPTQEEMEAYYRLRQNPNDPMSHFKD
ncbi:step II splicing factor slu7 [Echinococcus multilocularis]|uniref:Pre-mRNA-splicing factor SLU7 n=1 Tax=Echinococcus multilocularis TaxID=6211 RepID=A0A087W1Z9_ECHMU|nr:step II splicing factor slu7 [Echinococcus multilocularis]